MKSIMLKLVTRIRTSLKCKCKSERTTHWWLTYMNIQQQLPQENPSEMHVNLTQEH